MSVTTSPAKGLFSLPGAVTGIVLGVFGYLLLPTAPTPATAMDEPVASASAPPTLASSGPPPVTSQLPAQQPSALIVRPAPSYRWPPQFNRPVTSSSAEMGVEPAPRPSSSVSAAPTSSATAEPEVPPPNGHNNHGF